MYKISGTYCASLTPFNADFSINKKLLLEHCNNLLSQKVDGIAVFGSTGEGNSLSIEEKLDAINYLIENKIDPRKLLPSKKNRFSKESKPIIPYDLLKSKSSNISIMKEINVVCTGYHLSKLPNIKIHGYMGKLGKHYKLIQRIEKVLFN